MEKRLDNARNNFERGKTDVFPLEVPNLGELKRLVIRHDNTGPSPAWYCCSVSFITVITHGAVSFITFIESSDVDITILAFSQVRNTHP